MSLLLAASRRELVRTAARRSLGRRHLIGRVFQGLCVVAAIAAVAPLAALIYYTVSRGWGCCR